MAPNIAPTIAGALATGRATLHELMTVYSVEDCYTITEAASVQSYNAYRAEQYRAKSNG